MLKLVQVYVKEFFNELTHSSGGAETPTINRALFHGVHDVFPPMYITGHESGNLTYQGEVEHIR